MWDNLKKQKPFGILLLLSFLPSIQPLSFIPKEKVIGPVAISRETIAYAVISIIVMIILYFLYPFTIFNTYLGYWYYERWPTYVFIGTIIVAILLFIFIRRRKRKEKLTVEALKVEEIKEEEPKEKRLGPIALSRENRVYAVIYIVLIILFALPYLYPVRSFLVRGLGISIYTIELSQFVIIIAAILLTAIILIRRWRKRREEPKKEEPKKEEEIKEEEPKKEEPKPSSIRLTAEPELLADGKSTSAISIELLDEKDNLISAVEDMEIKLSTTLGKITHSVIIHKGESMGKATLASSTETGVTRILAESEGLTATSISMTFIEKRRYCMHCGAQITFSANFCSQCGRSPPSGVDVKVCDNCGEVIPIVAYYCSTCGAGQPNKK